MDTPTLIIQNGTVLTMDARLTQITEGHVVVSGKLIRAVGVGPAPHMPGAEVLDAHGGIILPGLVNSHTHAAMTLFRGLADDLPLMEWLNHYIFPAEARMDAKFVRIGTSLACAEMILSGTTTFCDMYLFEDAVAHAAADAGMRCLVGEVLYDFPSPNYGPIEAGFACTEALIQKWRDHPLVSIAVEPHATFTCSPELLRRANEMAMAHGVPLIAHVAETRSEVNQIVDKYGKRPVEFLDGLGLLGPQLIADHCVHLSEAEIDRMAETGARVVFNPQSNMKLASGIAPVPRLLKKGVPVGLGTDGCASNNSLDMFEEMDMAAKLPKIAELDPTVMDAVTVLKMATIDGARVLGLGRRVGSIEAGKEADIIVVDTRAPHLTPMYNAYSHLVYAARGSDVIHSVIAGRVVMENRRLKTVDVEHVMAAARQMSQKVREWTRGF